MENFFQILGKIAGIAGITVGVLLIIFREIIRKAIFPTFTKSQAYKTIRLIILLTFSIALIGLTFWFIPQLLNNKSKPVKLINNADTLTFNNHSDSNEFSIVQTSGKSILKLIDIYYDTTKKVFDVKVQNNSNNTVFVKAVELSIEHESSTRALNADPSGHIPFGIDEKQLENALLKDKDFYYSEEEKVSFKVPPHDVDRYLLSINADLPRMYRSAMFFNLYQPIAERNFLCSVNFVLFYNQNDTLSIKGHFIGGQYVFDVTFQ